MIDRNQELRSRLVALGVSMGVQRYVGQNPTSAAHEFAEAALEIIEYATERMREPEEAGEAA